ncbi:MAG TPA: plastocyanin/azurin family copper-binding protein [Gemmatimonadales bacterium]|nr:plastocyanin/azurin family copper-binding protein [Gemmatimonadales bacterium]
MRKTILAAGLVALAAACGGEKKAEEPAMTPEQPAAEAPAPAAATTGTTHDVNMVLEGTSYKYSPAELTIKAGDVVRFHNGSGGPHNVDFWADSIPAGAAAVLNAAMPDRMGELSGPLLVEAGAVYTVSFAGAPAGEYKFFCLPHLAMGMTGKLTVQ